MIHLLWLTSAAALGFEWNAPPECPVAEVVISEVKALRGDLPDSALTAHATVVHDGDWHVEIETTLRGVSGHRSLLAESCERAAKATAVVLSLALTDEQALPPLEVVALPPAAPETQQQRTGFSAALLANGRAGLLPSVIPGAGLAVAWLGKNARIEVAVFTPSDSQRVSTGPGTASDISVPLSGELLVGVPLIVSTVQLDLAFDAAWAWMSGRGVGPSVPLSGNAAWIAMEGGPIVHVPLWRGLQLRAEARLGGALIRPKFQVDGMSVYDTPVLTGRAAAGLEWIF